MNISFTLVNWIWWCLWMVWEHGDSTERTARSHARIRPFLSLQASAFGRPRCAVKTQWNAISASNYGSNLIICTHTQKPITEFHYSPLYRPLCTLYILYNSPFFSLASPSRSFVRVDGFGMCHLRGPHANAWNSPFKSQTDIWVNFSPINQCACV